MSFEYWQEAYIFIGTFFFLMLLPCVGVAFIGFKMIEKLGQHPSKTPAIQLSIFLQLVATEVVCFTLILLYFRVLSTANQ